MSLGISVKTGETPSSAGVSVAAGTAFIVGGADSGPFTAQKVASMGGWVALYGERSATSLTAYDSAETFFQLEGAQMYFIRAGKESSAAAAKIELETAGKTKVLVVTARYRGVFANKLQLVVPASGEELQVINEATGEVLETLKGATAEKFGPFPRETGYVTITEGSNYGTGKGEALKEITLVSKTHLSGGTNPYAEQKLTEALIKEALEKLPKTLGPGQVLAPKVNEGPTEEKTHIVMAEHASKNNRVALCDIEDNATVATLVANKKTYSAALAGYMAFFSSSCVVPGVTLGTTRTVPASAVVAGLCAQVAAGGNNSAAPAGVQWTGAKQGIAPFVTGFTNTFSLEGMQTLGENGINAFAERQSKPVLYNFVSALPKTTDKIFWQFSAARERMQLVWSGEEIGETFMFVTLDGRGQQKANFAGRLQGMLNREWRANAIYGATAAEAGIVNVGEPINTLVTMSEGQLNAELRVRLSPFVEEESIIIVSAPITEAL